MKNQLFRERIIFALSGLAAAWRRERSFRTEAVAGIAAGAALLLLRPSPLWWAMITLAISVVLAIELVNSAFEALVDHLHPGQHPEIRIIKDIAAGGVLLVSIAALLVGVSLVVAWLLP